MLADRPVLYLAVGQTLVWAALFYSFPAALLRWQAEFGWDRSDLTLAITLGILASALFSPLAGRLIDRGQGAALMGGSTLLGGLGLLALARVEHLWQFQLVWTVVGASLAGNLYDPCFAILTRARGAAAKPGIVAITLLAGFAGTLAFPAVHLLSETLGWRSAFAILGIFCCLFVAPLLSAGVRGLGPAQPIPDTPLQMDGRRGAPAVFWYLGSAFAILALVHGAALQHLLPILDERGIALSSAVFVASLIGPMQVAGRLAMVAADRSLTHHQFTLLAFAAMGASLAVLAVAGTSLLLLLIFVLLFGGAYGTVSILRPLVARDLLGNRDFGTISGRLSLMHRTAMGLAAWIGALIWEVGGYALMLGVLIGLAILGAGCYGWANSLARRYT